MHLAFGLGAGHLDLGLLHTDERRLSLVLKLIWRLASIVASRSLSVRLRARRCATFARASVTASSKPSSDNLPRTRACWARFLSMPWDASVGFSLTRTPLSRFQTGRPSKRGPGRLSAAVCRRLLDTCWTPKAINQTRL
jgi:hypothetical protein